MKNSLTLITLRNLLKHLMLIGASCNLFVGLGAIFAKDFFLLSICLLLTGSTAIAYVFSLTGKSKYGIHVMFGSYIIVFVCASFTHLAAFPLALIFPLVIGLVNLFSTQRKIKTIYIIVCLIGCVICTFNTHLFAFGDLHFMPLFNSLLIGVGLLFAFMITTELHGKMAITYQRELEESKESILKKNKSLKEYIKTNLQLENFAYLASHELRTPIKNVSSFSQLLEKKLHGKLDSKEKELFAMMKMEAWRMNTMMKDLLKLSQLSTKKVRFAHIAGQDFINKFIMRQFKDEKDQIIIENFPSEIYAAESQLNLLFLNIVDNAFKFGKTDKKTLIYIDCKENKMEYIFSIKDNGIGILDVYKERVFLIFKKLNGFVSSGNSGIGLSMCKEIVDRHRGQIWIEDNPKGGTVVNFTISKELYLLDDRVDKELKVQLFDEVA